MDANQDYYHKSFIYLTGLFTFKNMWGEGVGGQGVREVCGEELEDGKEGGERVKGRMVEGREVKGVREKRGGGGREGKGITQPKE